MYRYLSVFFFYLTFVNSSKEFGEFDMTLVDYTVCKGPKRKTCIDEQVNIINRTRLQYNLTIKEDATNVRAKVISRIKHQQILRLQLKNICEHVFIKPIVQTLFSLQNRCGFFKGHYLFSADIQTFAQKFFGGRFIYGVVTTNILLFNDYCNVGCGVMQIELTPKNSTLK